MFKCNWYFFNLQKRKEKGRVDLETVHTVEPADSYYTNEEVGIDGEYWPFLVGYHSDDDYTLFLLAVQSLERTDWILAIRQGNNRWN